VIGLVAASSGRGVICNRPCNGIEAIEQCGTEQLRGGSLIVYTSQDSVLQIAAHVDVVAPEELYRICRDVRERLAPEHAVGRVIARPFEGTEGEFKRTAGRQDFSIRPPSRSYLEEVQAAGIEVHTIGKTGQLFAGVGVDIQHPGATNARALAETSKLIGTLDRGLVFTHLVETDQVYGHRHDVEGFHRALREVDASVADWLRMLRADDLLVLTADHGCDVTSASTDHTREHVPLLAVAGGERPSRRDAPPAAPEGKRSGRHDGPLADVGASALSWLTDREAPQLPGDPFL
jgi:phosphopentomutase